MTTTSPSRNGKIMLVGIGPGDAGSMTARARAAIQEADTIIKLWKDHQEGISDRAIARELGRPQKTIADQMKKYRTDLRRITGDK